MRNVYSVHTIVKLGDVNEDEKIGERHSLSDRKQFMSVYGDGDGAGAYCVLLLAAFSDSQCSRARLGVHGTAGSVAEPQPGNEPLTKARGCKQYSTVQRGLERPQEFILGKARQAILRHLEPWPPLAIESREQ
jgi:hypothetical protein